MFRFRAIESFILTQKICVRSRFWRKQFSVKSGHTDSFAEAAKPPKTEKWYVRNILREAGCCVYSPYHQLKLSDDLLRRDEKIENLFGIAIQFQKNKFQYKSNKKLTHYVLPSIDSECLEGSVNWSTDQKLFTMDIWHNYLVSKKKLYFEKTLNDLLDEFDTLKHPADLQVLFYVSDKKLRLKPHHKQNIIRRMKRSLHKVPFDSIALYCLALKKSNSNQEDSQFMGEFLDYLLEQDLLEHNPMSVTMMVKAAVRFSNLEHSDQIKALQTKLLPFAEKAELITLTHIIQLGNTQRVYNQQLIELILGRFLDNIEQIRLKDVEKALLTIFTHDIKSPSRIEAQFCEKAQLRLANSLKTKFSSSIIRSVAYLTLLGFPNEDLIDHVLKITRQTEFAPHIANWEDTAFSLLTIDSFAKVNLSQTYKGYKLSDELVVTLKKSVQKSKQPELRDAVLDELKEMFERNNHNYIISWPNVTTAPCLFFVYNKQTNKSVKIEEPYDNGVIFRAADLEKNNPNLKAVVITVCGDRQLQSSGWSYRSYFELQINQLKQLGFEVVVLKVSRWRKDPSFELRELYVALQLYKQNVFLFSRGP